MVRTDNDSWDITESVGATALGVAFARAEVSATDAADLMARYGRARSNDDSTPRTVFVEATKAC